MIRPAFPGVEVNECKRDFGNPIDAIGDASLLVRRLDDLVMFLKLFIIRHHEPFANAFTALAQNSNLRSRYLLPRFQNLNQKGAGYWLATGTNAIHVSYYLVYVGLVLNNICYN